MADNKNNNSNNDSSTNHQMGMIGLLVVGAIIWKNEATIRLWFYNNVLFLVFAGVGLLGLVGLYLWSRFKKKEEEYFERRRVLRQVESQKNNNDYYKRKDY
jgi:hypothetical protein